MTSGTVAGKIRNLPAILSIQEVADFFSIHDHTVYRLIRRKALPAYKDGDGLWCVLRADLQKFCAENSNL
jgi:excisionase family DNA binding protein